MNRLTVERNKIPHQRWRWEDTSQALAQYQVQFAVERNEASVESRIVQRGEAKPVSRIQALRWKLPCDLMWLATGKRGTLIPHRIECGEVAQLHRQTVRRAIHLLRGLDDDGITLVKLSEGQLTVEI